MVIDNNGITPGSNGHSKLGETAAAKSKQPNSQTNTAAPAQESVLLSKEAQTLATLEARVKETPDVDSARVAEIKNAIDSGQYSVDAERIADKILSGT